MTLIPNAEKVVALTEAWQRRSGGTEGQTIEAVRELRAVRDAINAVPLPTRGTVPANPAEVRVHTAQMRLGPPPDGLHDAIVAAWAERQTAWASGSTLAELIAAIDNATEPARGAAADLVAQQLALAHERERCETVELLVAVLDEFVTDEPGETA